MSDDEKDVDVHYILTDTKTDRVFLNNGKWGSSETYARWFMTIEEARANRDLFEERHGEPGKQRYVIERVTLIHEEIV